jgi:hypothetical protein
MTGSSDGDGGSINLAALERTSQRPFVLSKKGVAGKIVEISNESGSTNSIRLRIKQSKEIFLSSAAGPIS